MTQPWYEPYLASVAQAVHPPADGGGSGGGDPDEYVHTYPRDSLDTSENLNKGNVLFSTVHQDLVSVTGNFTSGQSGDLVIYALDQTTKMVSALATKSFTTAGGEQEITFDTPVTLIPGQLIAVVVTDTASTGIELYRTNAPQEDENGFWKRFNTDYNDLDPIPVDYDFGTSATFDLALDVKSLVVTDSGVGDRQYWRMRYLEGQSSVFATVAELELRETVGGADTATTGNYIEGGHSSSNDGSLAFDDDAATWWRFSVSGGLDGDEWIGQDYGVSPVEIKEITVQSRTSPNQNQAPRQGVIEYSDDNVTWSRAWAFAGNNWVGAGEIRTYPDPNPGTGLPSANADEFRYWRLLCTSGGSATQFGIAALEFRSSPGGGNTATAANVLSSGPAPGGGGEAANAFNSTGQYVYWRDDKDESDEAWIGQDYGDGNEIGITEVLIQPPAGTNNVLAPLTFDMQASSDGVSWTTQWSGTCEEWTQDDQIISRDGFEPTTPVANGWRILVTETGTEGAVGIINMELRTSPEGPDATDLNNVDPNGDSDAKNIAGSEYGSSGAFGGQGSDSGWRSSVLTSGANTWLAFVFYQPRAIREVLIEADTVSEYAPLEFRIQYYSNTFNGTDGIPGGAQGTYLLSGGSWVDAGVFSVVAGDYDGSNELVLTLFE